MLALTGCAEPEAAPPLVVPAPPAERTSEYRTLEPALNGTPIALHWSPDRALLATVVITGDLAAVETRTTEVVVWRTADWATEWSFAVAEEVTDFCFVAPRTLAVQLRSGRLRWYTVGQSAPLRDVEADPELGHHLARSRSGELVVSVGASDFVKAWHATEGKLTATVNPTSTFERVAVSPDGSLIAFGGSRSSIHDVGDASAELWAWEPDDGRPYDLEFAEFLDAERLVTVDVFGIQVWRVEVDLPERSIAVSSRVSAFALAPALTACAHTSPGMPIWVTNLQTGEALLQFSAPADGALCLAFDEAGRTLAVAGKQAVHVRELGDE